MSSPLRILIVVDLPWDVRLGACRVWMELAAQWRALGHTVEHFSLSEAFPRKATSGFASARQQLAFPRKAAAFLRAHRQRFDLVDALIGALPFSKEELGFEGAIVARSVGLYRLYQRFEKSVWKRWPRLSRGRLIGRLFYRLVRQRLWRAREKAVRRADLINVPNEEEAACLRDEAGVTGAILVQPYGLTEEMRQALAAAAAVPKRRLAERRVCFIGMWSPRKGARDWARLIERVRARVPDAKFRFLGTMIDPAAIRRDLGPTAAERLELVTDYRPEELPGWLEDCTVGAFPSYVEGFGLALLEQLAAGLPTVAYDVAGPRDLLALQLPELLVPPGALDRFAELVVEVLLSSESAYSRLANFSTEAAAPFSWEKIARDTLHAYQSLLISSRPVISPLQAT